MQTLSPQELTSISGGFSSYAEDSAAALDLLEGSVVVGQEGINLIEHYIENSFLQATLKLGLFTSIVLFDSVIIAGVLFGKDDDDDY